MPFLTTSEFNKKLVEEISSVTEDLHVVSAFCKKMPSSLLTTILNMY